RLSTGRLDTNAELASHFQLTARLPDERVPLWIGREIRENVPHNLGPRVDFDLGPQFLHGSSDASDAVLRRAVKGVHRSTSPSRGSNMRVERHAGRRGEGEEAIPDPGEARPRGNGRRVPGRRGR